MLPLSSGLKSVDYGIGLIIQAELKEWSVQPKGGGKEMEPDLGQ
jgi:hypothetical protein